MLSFVSVLYFDPFSNMIASDTENLKFQGGQVHLNKWRNLCVWRAAHCFSWHLVLLLFCEFCAAQCKFGLERLYRKKVYYYHLLQTFLWWHLTNDVALERDPIVSAFQIAQFMNKTPLPLLTCLRYCTRKTGNDRLCTQQCSFQASDL